MVSERISVESAINRYKILRGVYFNTLTNAQWLWSCNQSLHWQHGTMSDGPSE